MRKVLSVLVAGVMFGACSDGLKSDLTKEDVSRFITTEEFNVPVKDGKVTIVTVGEDTVAIGYSEFPILVPKGVQAKVSYVDKNEDLGGRSLSRGFDDKFPNIVGENQFRLFQVICFEDSWVGDYDYNDLVIHVKYQQSGNIFGFGVQPVALGSTKEIKLGCDVYKGSKQIFSGLITKDKTCRKQMFNYGKEQDDKEYEGFLNVMFNEVNFDRNRTFLGSTIRSWDISKINGEGAMRVEWFIEVDGGTRIYALSVNHLKESLDKDKLPYGLVITETGMQYKDKNNQVCGKDWFNYPQEMKHIKDVYPEIWEWMNGKGEFDGKIYENGREICPEGAFNANELGVYVIEDDSGVLNNGRQN
ncbi:hypothetical protein AALK14_08180 [Butyricimonas hominis]|uniref:hypothetical protein n=1 Tax=Butyricimonas TaxID=574697 RepID=UPI0026DC364E|nr:hypothetical protein [uncultured Butyricimonas sp.]